MAQLAQLTTVEYTARFNDQISAGANASAQSLEKLAVAIEATEQRSKRAEGSFASLEARLDAGARLSQAKARSDEQLARQIDAINAATARGAITQERANQLTELAAQKQAVYVGQMQRQIAVEEQRNRAVLSGSAAMAGGATATTAFASANDNAAQSSGRFRQAMGQAGFQVQDFATQVSMGQNALIAFGVQFAQFAGIFGATGAIAGAAVMIGVIGANLLTAGDTAAEETRRMEANFGGMKKAAEEVANVIREINDLFLTASERSAAAANRQTSELAANAARLLDATIQRNESNSMELVQAQRDLAQQEARIAARDAEIRARTGSRANEFQRQDAGTLFPLRERIAGLEADIYRSNQRIGELNDALARARNAGVVGVEEFGPTAPRAPREPRSGGVDREAEARRREEERARREEERAQEQAAREAAREEARILADRERQNRQTTDEIVRYSADRFADLWSNTGRGFAGLMESMLQMVRRTFARIAAEAIIRPIVTPIVSNVVTPITESFGIGGATSGGVPGGGGMFGGIGSLLGSAGSSIGGFMAMPLFGAGAQASATNSALAAMPGGMMGPAAPSSLGLGGVTVGSFLGSAALGAGLGMAGGNLAGGLRGTANPMPGSMIGTGLGMGLGFLVGGPVGMAIGGAIGGTAGGMFGPTKKGMAARSGGDVFLGTDASGMLTITGARGKRFDEGAARAEVQAQLDAINQQIGARGLSFAGAGQNAVGFGQASGSPRELSMTRLVGQLRSGNANQMAAFGTLAGRGGNLEQALQAADFISQIFEPLGKAERLTSTFAAAMEALTKTYDEAITKARDLGLSESDLQARRAEGVAKLEADRNRNLDILDRTLAARRSGLAGDARGAGLAQFDLQAEAELRGFGDQLFNLGLDRTGEEYRRRVVSLEQAIADERLAIMRQFDQQAQAQAEEAARQAQAQAEEAARQAQAQAEEAARQAQAQAEQMRGITRGLLESLTLGDLGGLPLEARYGAALSSLSAAQRPLLDGATPEELAEFARVAQIALPIAKDFLGVSGSFAELVADVSRTLSTAAPGGDPANLGALLEAQVAGADRLEMAVIGTGQAQTDVLRSVLTELKRLTSQTEAILART
jgi:hypothetical protein